VANARVDVCGTQLRLTMKLRTFEKPDTASKQTGSLDEGDYRVFEILRNVSEADYVRVQSDRLPAGEGWICARSKDSHYALLYDSVEKEGAVTTNAQGEYSVEVGEKRLHRLRFVIENYFDGESERLLPFKEDVEVELDAAPNSVKESYLIDRIDDFKNFSYNREDGWYPYELPDVSVAQAPPRQNNCSTMVEGLAIKAWKDARGDDFTWSLAKHNRMMITSTEDYFSPVTETVASGLGIEIDADDLPSPWTLVQGWKTQWTGGHNFFIVDVHPDTERILTLESNNTYEMDGPGFRMLGDIDDFEEFNPGKDWWKNATLWTWKKFKETYPHRKMARLKVHDQRWVR
jgi:hypothetical protein